MEPMALGSPSSPGNTYLPQFLMGDNDPAVGTPGRTTLSVSPTKLGVRSLAFGQSPPTNSPISRSSLFHNHRNPMSPQQQSSSGYHHQNLNASVSGPPTQGLFDSLASSAPAPQHNESLHRQVTSPFSPVGQAPSAVNEALYTPRRTSIIPGPKHNFTASPFPVTNVTPSVGATINQTQTMTGSAANYPGIECWVTVFGFPQSATSMILSHFSQCGTIINKMQPKNIGNWLHLRFTSRLECDRALNFNEKVLNNFFMIGVVRCKDPAVLELEQQQQRAEDMENSSFVGNSTGTPVNLNASSIRPLAQAHIAYKTTVQSTDVVASPSAPTKSSGILDRAMDFFLSW